MGYNTPVLILNDGEGEIAGDPQAGEKIAAAVRKASLGKPVDVILTRRFPSGGSCTSAPVTVLPPKHADATRVIVIGQNSIRELAELWYVGSSDEDVLKALADSLGYRIVKKPVRRAA
jgi:hypothetical protein